jgi:hypothetical protein
MVKRLKSILLLIIFLLGLVPGEYWILLHQHKHGKISRTETVSIHKPVRVCESQTHLYDFIKGSIYFDSSTVAFIQIVIAIPTRHFPHPSFLNNPLRAPPGVKSTIFIIS